MLRLMMLTAVGVVLLAIQTQAEDRAKERDATKLVGTWTVTNVETDSKKADADTIKGKEVKITRDTITCYDKNGKSEMAYNYTIDTSATPCKLELTCTSGEHKGKKLQGIARADGDTLKVCFAKPESNRPASFETREGQCCMTLTRSTR